MRSLLTLLFLCCATLVQAQQFPSRPVRMVVGFAPGGGTDIIARLASQKLSERWGQPVVVENRTGASGNIGAELVARSAPDGYTLLTAFSSHASNAALSKLSFDINKDFTSITQIASGPAVVIANPAVPGKTLAGMLAYARANPNSVKYGSSGVGTPVHLAGELMQQMTGVQMVHVPYKGIAPAMTAILAGDIHISFATPLSALGHLKSGKLVGLAVAAPSRFPTLPDVPTAAEAGLPGYDVDFWYGLLGPAGMPAALVERIQHDVAAVLTAPETKESLLAQGCVAVAGPPQALTALITREYELWAKVVKAGGVKME
jgi:tripartite-type tricarboxylate transporter receptor subunit TctC